MVETMDDKKKRTYPGDKNRYRFVCVDVDGKEHYIYAHGLAQAKRIYKSKGIEGRVMYDDCEVVYQYEYGLGEPSEKVIFNFRRTARVSPLAKIQSLAYNERGVVQHYEQKRYIIQASVVFIYRLKNSELYTLYE